HAVSVYGGFSSRKSKSCDGTAQPVYAVLFKVRGRQAEIPSACRHDSRSARDHQSTRFGSDSGNVARSDLRVAPSQNVWLAAGSLAERGGVHGAGFDRSLVVYT